MKRGRFVYWAGFEIGTKFTLNPVIVSLYNRKRINLSIQLLYLKGHMAKQTLLLFLRAFIIGILLNLGIQSVADISLSQNSQQTSTELNQPSANSQIVVLN